MDLGETRIETIVENQNLSILRTFEIANPQWKKLGRNLDLVRGYKDLMSELREYNGHCNILLMLPPGSWGYDIHRAKWSLMEKYYTATSSALQGPYGFVRKAQAYHPNPKIQQHSPKAPGESKNGITTVKHLPPFLGFSDEPQALHISVHVRRGDVSAKRFSDKWLPNVWYACAVTTLLHALRPWEWGRGSVHIHVTSLDTAQSLDSIRTEVAKRMNLKCSSTAILTRKDLEWYCHVSPSVGFPNQNWGKLRVRWSIPAASWEEDGVAFAHLAASDVLICSESGFSKLASIVSHSALSIGPDSIVHETPPLGMLLLKSNVSQPTLRAKLTERGVENIRNNFLFVDPSSAVKQLAFWRGILRRRLLIRSQMH